VIYIIAHPQAIKEKIRYREKNLNRCFGQTDKGYEEDDIAREIEIHLQQADYLLDIHNTTNTTSTPFIISEHPDASRSLPIQTALS
jgi:succinylglutamate desuccinylase